MVRNVDPSLQTGPASIGFAELDAVSKEHPVFVLNASGHLAYANRHAFAVAGIPEGVMNPEGAEFVRDGSGRLSDFHRSPAPAEAQEGVAAQRRAVVKLDFSACRPHRSRIRSNSGLSQRAVHDGWDDRPSRGCTKHPAGDNVSSTPS